MTQPTARRGVSLAFVFDVIIVLAAVGLTIYFLVDDTPVAWMIRLAYAGAIVAGGALALHALARLSGR